MLLKTTATDMPGLLANQQRLGLPHRLAMIGCGIVLLATTASGILSCSNLNREGPLVTCADLQNGQINACKEGIIASCSDGQEVTYQVCTDDFDATETAAEDICEAKWQVPGAFQCKPSCSFAQSHAASGNCMACLSNCCNGYDVTQCLAQSCSTECK